MEKPVVEAWAEKEYGEGISAHAAARQLCRELGCSGHYPALKRMLEDLLAEANDDAQRFSRMRNLLREVTAAIPKH